MLWSLSRLHDPPLDLLHYVSDFLVLSQTGHSARVQFQKCCTEERNRFPWPADYILANGNQYAVELIATRTLAYSCPIWLWGLQASFLQSYFLAICIQPVLGFFHPTCRTLHFPLSFQIMTPCFSSLLRCPWVAALPSSISTDQLLSLIWYQMWTCYVCILSCFEVINEDLGNYWGY